MNARTDWLEEKRRCIGASDVAPIIGEDPFRGPWHVWMNKVHGYSQEDTKRMQLGRVMEHAISKMYAIETKRQVIGDEQNETEIQYHSDIPWLGVTLDELTVGNEEHPAPDGDDGAAPLELKNSSGFIWKAGKWKRSSPGEWKGDPPRYQRIQNQVQMACMNSRWGSLASLFPSGEVAWIDQTRNDRLLNATYPVLERFWRLVETRQAPAIDDFPSTLDIVKACYPNDTGETVVLTDEEESLVIEWLKVKDEKSAYEKKEKFLQAQIRYVLKDATFGACRRLGQFLTLKTTHTKGYTKTVEPGKYRTLRIAKKI